LESCSAGERQKLLRSLCRIDLYFLLRYVLARPDLEDDWLFARCREIGAAPDGFLDLWARDHYKSTIITFGKTIQDILASHGVDAMPSWQGREATFGFFSHNRPIAKKFLRQIKVEFERNAFLKWAFPDVLYADPKKESPKWSEDEGIVVKRNTNPGESTVEAWGLVDGMPTGKHFLVLVYDDVVTRESVSTPDMIEKTTEALALSYNLGADGGRRRFIGTRYHYNDTYRTVIERGTAAPRIYPATIDGAVDGEPAFLARDTLAAKRRDMGPYVFGCQMLQNPKADETQGFMREWLRFYQSTNRGAGMTKYLLVDPANSKRRGSDYTTMWVVGLGQDDNFYALDMVRDRLSLTQRAARVIALHRKWRPLQVRYEEYGMQADIQHIESVQEAENYRFRITTVGGQVAKPERIKRLIPIFEQGRMWLPVSLSLTNFEGETRDLVRDFIEDEYMAFPVPLHDDMLDSLARIAEPDLPLKWPAKNDKEESEIMEDYQPLDAGMGY
jgi:phage terminase large subunit-like protein